MILLEAFEHLGYFLCRKGVVSHLVKGVGALELVLQMEDTVRGERRLNEASFGCQNEEASVVIFNVLQRSIYLCWGWILDVAAVAAFEFGHGRGPPGRFAGYQWAQSVVFRFLDFGLLRCGLLVLGSVGLENLVVNVLCIVDPFEARNPKLTHVGPLDSRVQIIQWI